MERRVAMNVKLRTPVGLRVLLVDDNEGRRSMFETMLTDCGFTVAAADAPAMVAAVAGAKPDVILINETAPDDSLFARVRRIGETCPTPIALFSDDGRQETIRAAVSAGVNSYVVVGINGNRIRTAIDTALAHFDSAQDIRTELIKATEALAERKLIEKAKGILMKQKGLGEDDAYHLLRKTAMERNLKIADVARTINEAAGLLI